MILTPKSLKHHIISNSSSILHKIVFEILKTHSVFYHNFCCSNSSPNYSPENNIRCSSACLSKQKHKFTTDLHSLGNFKLHSYIFAKFIPLTGYKAYIIIAWKVYFWISHCLYFFFYPFINVIWFKDKVYINKNNWLCFDVVIFTKCLS